MDINWNSTNPSIGSLKNEKGEFNILDLKKQPGKLEVKSQVNSLKSKNRRFKQIEDVITVESFRLLDIEPKNSVLYLHKDNFIVLKIINGSGNFEVKMSEKTSSLANMKYDSN